MATHTKHYNHYGFIKPSNNQYVVPNIQLKCNQNDNLSKFDVQFNNLKTNQNVKSTIYLCSNNKWSNFLQTKPDMLSAYRINIKEEQINQLSALKDNKPNQSFFSKNTDNFMIINLSENDFVTYKDDEYVFIQDQSDNPKITEKELNDMFNPSYEYSYLLIMIIIAIVFTVIAIFGMMKYLEYKRTHKHN